MVLSHEEIKSLEIISPANPDNFENASYDLTVKDIVDMEGKSFESCKIIPQGMIYVVFEEKIKLNLKTIGFAHVKTSLTQRGIMATNIGIIDPGYDGYVSTLLINFGSSDFFIKKGMVALRVTFNVITQYQKELKPKFPTNNNYEKYLLERQKNTDVLDKKFLNLDKIQQKVFLELLGVVIGLGILFTSGNFFLNAYTRYENKHEIILREQMETNNKQMNSLNDKNDSLKRNLDSIITEYNGIKKDLDSILRKKN